ncbi:MAG: VWA domain-containing protein, partial [Planctomycetota bacterium]
YWGIPLDQDGVLFCVDRSASMNFYDRLPDARRELAATVGRLPSSVRFNVTFFNDSMHWWQERLVPAGPLAKYRLKQALPELEAKRYTDLLGLLKNVFRFEQGLSERPASAGRLKTVFLLTDGLPSKQFITDGEVIRRHVAGWNPGKRVTIHAIGLGMSDERFLVDLAEANGGKAVFKGRRK